MESMALGVELEVVVVLPVSFVDLGLGGACWVDRIFTRVWWVNPGSSIGEGGIFNGCHDFAKVAMGASPKGGGNSHGVSIALP